jgi:hypothetical protein
MIAAGMEFLSLDAIPAAITGEFTWPVMTSAKRIAGAS